MAPASMVSVKASLMPSSAATRATPSAMPTPRLITMPARSVMAARRAITLRAPIGRGGTSARGIRRSPLNAGE